MYKLKNNNFLPLQSLVVYWEKHVNQGITEIFFVPLRSYKGEAHNFKTITTGRPNLIWEVNEGFSEQVISESKSKE